MKANVSRWIGELSLSADVEIDSSSESDITFAHTVLSSVVKIPKENAKIVLEVDGKELAQTVREAFDSTFGNDAE